MASPITVETSWGWVSGSQADGVAVFRGLPFAAPPVGELRFQPPVPPRPWAGIRDANLPGPICPQPITLLEQAMGLSGMPMDEDCLYLDVFTPSPNGSRPVMVWFHGGAFRSGAGSAAVYDGSALVRNQDVVVVTCNYRIGVFGYTDLSDIAGPGYEASGNAGLLDQLAALRWIAENIAAFGGSPDSVCLFGESAGAVSIAALMALPDAKGLFHRAILQSGAPSGILRPDQAQKTAAGIFAKLRLGGGGTKQLRQISSADLLEAQIAVVGDHPLGMPFAPVHDGHILPLHPLEAVAGGASAGIELMVGTNAHESRLFRLIYPSIVDPDEATLAGRAATMFGEIGAGLLLEAYADRFPSVPSAERWEMILDAMLFHAPAQKLLDHHSTNGGIGFAYRFEWESPALGGILGACHGLEVPFVFDNLDKDGVELLVGNGTDTTLLASTVSGAWATFAREGRPFSTNLPSWPTYELPIGATMALGNYSRVLEDPDSALRALWSRVPPGGVIPA